MPKLELCFVCRQNKQRLTFLAVSLTILLIIGVEIGRLVINSYKTKPTLLQTTADEANESKNKIAEDNIHTTQYLDTIQVSSTMSSINNTGNMLH